jgi:hypothetical protein
MTATCIICGRAAEQGYAEWSAADVILREPEQDAVAGPLPNYASQAPVCNACVRSLCAKVLLDAIELADGLTIHACPNCHEARMDFLVFNDDGDFVRCTTCGKEYEP